MTLESTALQVLLPSFDGTTLPDRALSLLEEGLGGLCLVGGLRFGRLCLWRRCSCRRRRLRGRRRRC